MTKGEGNEDDSWRNSAACGNMPTRIFFDDIWQITSGTNKAALAAARAICDPCPVRRECLVEELAVEDDAAPKFRFGLRAGLTPAQRASLRRLDVDYSRIDPVTIRSGNLATMTGESLGKVQALPDQGNDWLPRHELLAKRVIAFMTEHIAIGTDMPSASGLAKTLGVRKADVRRVYFAMADDGTIEPRDGCKYIAYVRVK